MENSGNKGRGEFTEVSSVADYLAILFFRKMVLLIVVEMYLVKFKEILCR